MVSPAITLNVQTYVYAEERGTDMGDCPTSMRSAISRLIAMTRSRA